MSDQIPNPKRNILAAWLVGGFIYMFFAMEVVADAGFMAIPFQFIMGAVFSIVLVGFATLLGFSLRIPLLGRIWYSSIIPSVVVLACATVVILFGRSIGITATVTSKSGITYSTLHPAAAYGSLLAAVFATLHLPWRRVLRGSPSV